MNKLKKISCALYVLVAVFNPLNSFASCKTFHKEGLLLIKTKGQNSRLLSTSQIDVESEDEIFRAFSMAENKAKIALMKELTKNEMGNLSNLIKKGQCYEPGKFVRVTFGKTLEGEN